MSHVNRYRVAVAVVAIAAAAATAGCRSDEAVQLRSYPVQVATPVVWTGTQIVLIAPRLSGADTVPVVVIGTDTVAVRFAAPDSLIAVAPSVPGLFEVRVSFAGAAPASVGTVRLAGGYAGVWNAANVGGRPQAWPGTPQTSVAMMTGNPWSGPGPGLALVDPRTRTVRQVLDSSLANINCMNGVGPAFGSQVVVGNCAGKLSRVQPEPFLLASDTAPTSGGRFAAQLAPGRWLVAYHHGVSSYLRNASGGWDVADTSYHIEEPFDIVVSPSGDRAVVTGIDVKGTGMPVFSGAAANPVYLLPAFWEIWGGAFNDAGDSIFVIGAPPASVQPDPLSHPILAILSAADGRVLRSVPAWPGAYRLVLDPGGRWIYLAGAVQDTSVSYRSLAPAVQVLDRASLAPVTTLHAPFGTDILGLDLYPMPSLSESRLYLVATCAFCSAGATPIYAFDLMP